MSHRSPSHWPPIVDQRLGDRVTQRGRERVELHDVWPRREVRVASRWRRSRRRARMNASGCSRGPARSRAAGNRGVRASRGGRAPRGWERSRGSGQARGAESCSRAVASPAAHRISRRRCSRGRNTESRSHRRVPDPAARRGTRPSRLVSAERDAKSFRAALPDAHQPYGVNGQSGQRIPLRRRHVSESHRLLAGVAQSLKPRRRVDLVQGQSM